MKAKKVVVLLISSDALTDFCCFLIVCGQSSVCLFVSVGYYNHIWCGGNTLN